MLIPVIATLLLTHADVPGFLDYAATPQRCYDGDTCTFMVHLGFGVVLTDQRVRLCDLNAPEIRGETREEGRRVRDNLWERLSRAKRVTLRVPTRRRCDREAGQQCERRGKYGRWLAYIISDGVNLNRWLIKTGDARRFGNCGLLFPE